jgi:uncharacterized protein YbdZ (MbtH family)
LLEGLLLSTSWVWRTDEHRPDNGSFFALVNDDEQHSLWPAFGAVPAGWGVVYDEAGRAARLGHLEQNWHKSRCA